MFGSGSTCGLTAAPGEKPTRSKRCPLLLVVTLQSQRSDQFALALGHTDAWHCDFLKEVRAGDHGGRIRGEAGKELWMREGGAVEGRRLPNGVVQIGRAVPDGAVKLSRDEPRLPLHEGRVVLPGLEETCLIGFVQRDQVHENDGGGIDHELSVDRKRGVEGAK